MHDELETNMEDFLDKREKNYNFFMNNKKDGFYCPVDEDTIIPFTTFMESVNVNVFDSMSLLKTRRTGLFSKTFLYKTDITFAKKKTRMYFLADKAIDRIGEDSKLWITDCINNIDKQYNKIVQAFKGALLNTTFNVEMKDLELSSLDIQYINHYLYPILYFKVTKGISTGKYIAVFVKSNYTVRIL